jgi:hypothetical protein
MSDNKLTPAEKRRLLSICISLHIKAGYNFDGFIGHELSYFDYGKVYGLINVMNKECIKIGCDSYSEFEDIQEIINKLK